MPTNTVNLAALLDALYDGPHAPEKRDALIAAALERIDDTQTQAKFGVNKAALNANQKAFFALQIFRQQLRQLLSAQTTEPLRQQHRQAMRAAEEAAGAGL